MKEANLKQLHTVHMISTILVFWKRQNKETVKRLVVGNGCEGVRMNK